MVSVPVFFGVGCGGLAASQSVSPLDFLLPGIVQNQSRVVPPVSQDISPLCPQTNQVVTLAKAN